MSIFNENGIIINESKKNELEYAFRGVTINVDDMTKSIFNSDIKKYDKIVKKILNKYDDAFKQSWIDKNLYNVSFKDWKSNIKVTSGRIIIFSNDVVSVEFNHAPNTDILGPMHFLTIYINYKDDKFNYEFTIDG